MIKAYILLFIMVLQVFLIGCSQQVEFVFWLHPLNPNELVLGRFIGTTDQVVIPYKHDGMSVSHIAGRAFQGTSISEVVIPTSVKTIGGSAFAGVSTLKHVHLSEGLQLIGSRAFAGTSITEIIIPTTILQLSESFLGANYLATVDFATPRNDILEIRDWAFAFTNISEIHLPDGIRLNSSAFEDMSRLKRVTLGDGHQEIGLRAFVGTSITEIDIPSSVRFINTAAFLQVRTLNTIRFNEGLEAIGPVAFLGTSIGAITFPESFRAVHRDAFANVSELTTLILNEGIERIEANAFVGTSLTDVVIPSSIVYLSDYAFDAHVNITFA